MGHVTLTVNDLSDSKVNNPSILLKTFPFARHLIKAIRIRNLSTEHSQRHERHFKVKGHVTFTSSGNQRYPH